MQYLTNLIKAFKFGMHDTLEISGHYLKHITSTKRGKATITIMLLIIVSIMFVAFNLPVILIGMISKLNMDSMANNNLNQILLLADKDNGQELIIILFWSYILSSIFIPVVSNSILSIYNKSSMIGLKKNDLHQITDSLLLQFVSVVTLIEFLATTAIISLIRFTHDISPVVYLYAFSIWFMFSVIACFNAWVVEFVLRKYGVKGKVLLIGGEIIVIFALWLGIGYDFYTLFGIPKMFIDNFSNVGFMLIQVAIFALIAIAFMIAAVGLGANVINRYMPFTSNKKARSSKILSTPYMVGKIFWRNGNIKTPVMMMFAVSLLTVASVGNNASTLVGFILALPLVLSMSYMVNIFGLIGSGNSWAFSLSGFTSKVLKFFSWYNVLLIVLLNGILIIVAWLMHGIEIELMLRFIGSTTVTAIIMTMFSMLYSARKPLKYDVHIRGENILSPARAIAVLFMLITFGGVLGIVTFNYIPLAFHAPLIIVTAILFAYVLRVETKRLSAKTVANEIISATS